MTPIQLVRAECANYKPENGGCKGVIINDDLSLSRMTDTPKVCLLAKSGQRCAYFESSVLPMAYRMDEKGARGIHPSGRHYDTVHLIANRKVEYMEAAKQYRIECNVAKNGVGK